MFDDPNKELEALQAQLDAQEEWFQRELDSAKRMIGQEPERKAAPAAPVRNYANNYGNQPIRKAYVPDIPEIQEEEPPKKKSVRGLVILASLELLGIFAILGYWAWYFLG